MATATPYTFIQCSCSDQPPADAGRVSPTANPPGGDERTFDPRAPRSSYSLYPLEYLLYCEDCQQIRCPRCVTEETVTYFCPNCLFEVPSSNLRSEGNRYIPTATSCIFAGINNLIDVQEAVTNVPTALAPFKLSLSPMRPKQSSSDLTAHRVPALARLRSSVNIATGRHAKSESNSTATVAYTLSSLESITAASQRSQPRKSRSVAKKPTMIPRSPTNSLTLICSLQI